MIRETKKTIIIDRTVQEEVVLNKEEISEYAVDIRNKNITVVVRFTGDETGRVETETYRFFSNDYIDEPTEENLWQLVDKKRSDR